MATCPMGPWDVNAEMSAGFMSTAIAALLGAAVLGVSFIPSKRGHKD